MIAPRFVAVGRARVQVLEGVAHDPAHADAVVATLDALRPEVLLLDRSRADWDSVRAGRLDAFSQRLFDAVESTGTRSRPDVLWREAKAWGTRTGARVGVIHQHGTEAPRKGIKRLDKMLRKEGFEAASPQAAVHLLVERYVHRVPELRAWLMERRDETARRLWKSLAGNEVRATVLFAAPDAEPVCDRLVQASRQARERQARP